MDIKYRLQTWAADRFDRVQYPRPVRVRPEQPKLMPFGAWLSLVVIGGAATLLGGTVLLFMIFFFWPAVFG